MFASAACSLRCLLGFAALASLSSSFTLDARDIRYHRAALGETPTAFSVAQSEFNAFSGLDLDAAHSGGGLGGAGESDQVGMLTSNQARTAGLYVFIKDTVKFIVGAVLVLLSVPALWFYERQQARMDSLFSTARSSCVSLAGAKASPEFCGQLTHVTGWQTRPAAIVRDPRFPGVTLKEGCVRWRTQVQVYQVLDRRSSTRSGAQGNIAQGWSEVEQGVLTQEAPRPSSVAPPGLRMGTTVTNCGLVELGPGFTLPDALVDQCRSFRPADHLLEDTVTTVDGKLTLRKHSDGYFYFRQGATAWSPGEVAEAPQTGDARVYFEHVAPGPVTVLALQVEPAAGSQRMMFAPFRLVARGLCGLGAQEERLALMMEARKSREKLAREDQCFPGRSICCGCNLLSRCYSGVLTPEIFCLFDGTKSADDCLREAAPTGGWRPWVVRLLLYMTMCAGFFLTALAIVIGLPMLKDLALVDDALGPWIRPLCCIVLTLFFSAVIMSTAYLPFRPLAAICSLCVIAAAVLVPWVLAVASGGAAVLLETPPGGGGPSGRPALLEHALARLRGLHGV